MSINYIQMKELKLDYDETNMELVGFLCLLLLYPQRKACVLSEQSSSPNRSDQNNDGIETLPQPKK